MTSSNALAERECLPCKGGAQPIKGEPLSELYDELGNGWEMVEEHHLTKHYKFDDWAGAMAFANRVSDLAEEVDHHPDLHIEWGNVGIKIWSHKAGGLTETDFVFAARADRLV